MDPNAHAMAVALAAQAMASHSHHQPQPSYQPNPMISPPTLSSIPPAPDTLLMSPTFQLHQQQRRQQQQQQQQQQHQQQQHQQHQQHEAQHLYYQTPTTYIHPDQQINTLFVAGLPDDVKAREIHNLFRRRYGFQSCQLKYTGRGDQVVAFVTFIDHQSAIMAMSTLNGATFDPLSGATLHIELARSNSRTKRPRGGSGPYTIIDKRVKVPNDEQENWSDDGDGDVGSDEPPGTNISNSSNRRGLPSAQSGDATGDLADAKVDTAAALNGRSEKPATGENPKCSTLFIANLGPKCTEEELTQTFSQYPGFVRLKMQGKGGMPIAFADFQDAESATEAMNSLQGTFLMSSDRGGMHLEYARSKMRK